MNARATALAPSTAHDTTASVAVGVEHAHRSWWPARKRRQPVTVAPPQPELQAILDLAVGAFRSQVLGTRCGRGPDRDARVRVVATRPLAGRSPSDLEVWVLLGDIDEERVPAHWDPTQVLADVHLTSWALRLRGALVDHLARSQWPDPYSVMMRVDAADRVERRGGRAYLLGPLAA